MPRATPAAYTHSHPPPPQILSDDSYKTFLKRNWKSFDVRDMPVLEDEKTKASKPRRSRRCQPKPTGGGGKEESKGDEDGDLHGIRVRGAPPRHRVRRAHHSPRPLSVLVPRTDFRRRGRHPESVRGERSGVCHRREGREPRRHRNAGHGEIRPAPIPAARISTTRAPSPRQFIQESGRIKSDLVDKLATELADTLVKHNNVLKKTIQHTKKLQRKHKTELAVALAAAPAAPAAPAPDAMAVAVNAEVVKLRDQVSKASGQVTLLRELAKAAQKDQKDAMRDALALEGEVKRLREELAAARALAAARDGQASGDPSPKPPETNAGAVAGAGGGEPPTKRQKLAGTVDSAAPAPPTTPA